MMIMCLAMFQKYANDGDDYDEQLSFFGGGEEVDKNMYLSCKILCRFIVGMFGLKS